MEAYWENTGYLQRFKREAQLAARLHHSQICPIHHYGVVERDGDKIPFLAMRYIDGDVLADLLRRQGRYVPSQAVELVLTLALAMDYAHRSGVIHRDLKPGNIIIQSDGRPIILDFGLARFLAPDSGQPRLTVIGLQLGTRPYMSPEQFHGDPDEIDPRCDVYALGVVLFELVTGRPPYAGTAFHVQFQVCSPSPPPAPGIDPELDRVCQKAMAKNRDDRYQDMAAFARELSDYLSRRAPLPAGGAAPAVGDAEPPPGTLIPADRVAVPGASVGSIGMSLVRIESGSFEMGSTSEQIDQLFTLFPGAKKEWFADEQPRHLVEITRPFYLGIDPVTQGQYRSIMGPHECHFKGSDDLPVESVSWLDAVAFCNKLSEREGQEPCYRIEGDKVTVIGGNGFRLPTEAEWEYACRAGSETLYPFGDDPKKLGEYAWYSDNAGGQTHPVGQKTANAWGLRDMLGNVWEWCADGYDEKYYVASPGADPPGAAKVSPRVIRGGAWVRRAEYCRPALREGSTPELRGNGLGFRVAAVQG
jgi:formylglycine-generating enzyme required for sulfatase activity